MEYMTEQFDLDMRKAGLYSKNAYIEYEFAVEEAFLESPEYVEYVVTEAAGNLIEKVRAVFKKIIESVKKFFSGLIEKVKSFFSNNKEEKLKKAVQANPALAKQKVEVPNLKEIEDVCGKRAMLRKKMIAEYKAGKLTRDRFDELVEQNEKLGKRLKTVGVVTLAIGTIVGGIFAASKVIPNLKKTDDDTSKVLEDMQNKEEKRIVKDSEEKKESILPVINKPGVASVLDPQNKSTQRLKIDTPTTPKASAKMNDTSVINKPGVASALDPQNKAGQKRSNDNRITSGLVEGEKKKASSTPETSSSKTVSSSDSTDKNKYALVLVPGTEVAKEITTGVVDDQRAETHAKLVACNKAMAEVTKTIDDNRAKMSALRKTEKSIGDEMDRILTSTKGLDRNSPEYREKMDEVHALGKKLSSYGYEEDQAFEQNKELYKRLDKLKEERDTHEEKLKVK